MAKRKVTEPSTAAISGRRPAYTPEARENQLISLAMDAAEKQLIEGTASSQVISHFLKLGSSREKLERLKLEREISMIEAKKNSLESSQRTEELYTAALEAMKRYSGSGMTEDD